MKPWFIYILKCSDGTYYIGITDNIEKRLSKHNLGLGAKYTRGRTPVVLVYSEQVATKSEALKKEIELKKWSRKEKESLFNK